MFQQALRRGRFCETFSNFRCETNLISRKVERFLLLQRSQRSTRVLEWRTAGRLRGPGSTTALFCANLTLIHNVFAKRGKRRGFTHSRSYNGWRARTSFRFKQAKKSRIFAQYKYDRFDLDEMHEAECEAEFRIEERDIFLSADSLGLPVTFRRTFDLHFYSTKLEINHLVFQLCKHKASEEKDIHDIDAISSYCSHNYRPCKLSS